MNAEAEQLSGELAVELADNSRRQVIDPRTVPCRFSTLKQFALSPLHYWHACQDSFEETLSMRIGSGAHALLFDQPIAVWNEPAKNGNGKAKRAGDRWNAFRAENAGKTIVNAKEHWVARNIADAIRRHPLASELLESAADVEKRIDWSWDGREFRSTPDVLGETFMVDLKCLRSAEPERVMWQSRSMNYHAQAALYKRAVKAAHGTDLADCYLLVVENKPPHPVTVMRFSSGALDQGDRSCVLWNERRRMHEETNEWPGYVQSIVELALPGEEEIDDLGLIFGDEESDAA